MPQPRSYSVTILGERYALKSDADGEYIESLARLVDGKMKDLRRAGGLKLATPTALAVLTALQLADELARERGQRRELGRKVRERTQALRAWLDHEVEA